MTDSPSRAALNGTWQMVRAQHAGTAAPEFVVQRTTLQFLDGTYCVRFDGETVDQGTTEIGHSGALKTVVLFSTSGPHKGRTIRAIFQHVGDRLRVCYGLDDIQPLDFSATEGQNRYLATYRRTSS